MEPLNSSSLGAMGSLLMKLEELLRIEHRVEGLMGDLRHLSTKLKKLSEVQLPHPPLTVKYWMNDARELSYEMEVCMDQFILVSHPKVDWIQKAWIKEILGFADRVEEVNERYDRYNLFNKYIVSCPTKTSVSHHQQTLHKEHEAADPVGMEEPTHKLLEWLMPVGHGEDDLKLKVATILGEDGLGKSTLVKMLWRLTAGKFESRAFVQTAKKADTRTILRSILKQVRPQQPLKASKVPDLINALREHLQKKRYFIVIDDLWDVSVWHIVRRGFPDGNSRIITTTAAENVAQSCCSYDRNSIVTVKCLSGDQSKKLFVDIAFGSEKGCPPQFNDVTDEITRKCGGSPLAIIWTAGLVANQPETAQGQQLDYVKNFLPDNLRKESSSTEILTEVLNLCYSKLPCCLRTCLLYLSLYPENYLFLKEDLVKQWMAEDFICTEEGNDIVDVAGSCFDELVSLGLIQRMDIINYNKKGLLSYTLHPVVFDFIICKSMEDNFVTTIDYSQSTAMVNEKVRRLSLHFGSATYATTPASVELSQVRSLSFMGLLGCMPSIAEFVLVRVVVLHIRSDDGDTKFSLAEICKLLLLRYVQVRCNVTVELPQEMQCLEYLETLEIDAGVEYVPSDIVHLSRLRHVRLGEKTKRIPGHEIASGVNSISSVDWSRLPSAASMSLESFELRHPICMFSRLPPWFRQLRKLRSLEIVVRQLSEDSDALAELPFLKRLSLYVRTRPTGVVEISSTGAFPALEYFKFACGVLSLDIHKGTLPNLRKLKLVFNAHKGEQYRNRYSSNMLAGIGHLLNLQKVAASIGLAPGAEESDRIAAESAFKDAVRQHPSLLCHRRSLEEVVKRAHDPVDEDYWNQRRQDEDECSDLEARSPQPHQVQQVPMWKLAFRRPPQLRVFTGTNVEDDTGRPLEVILVGLDDDDTAGSGSTPKLPGTTLSIQLVPLAGDFVFPKSDDDDDPKYWTEDEFERAVVSSRHRQGRRRPLLTGDVRLTMRNGRATVCSLRFTDNSSWVRSGKFRIGVRVEPGSYDGGGGASSRRILEAITEPIVVRENPARRKHYPPYSDDEVWRLDNIAKGGAFHKKLEENNIKTVEEFLRVLTVKPDDLRYKVLGMTGRRLWEKTTNHAKTCAPGDKVYVYHGSDDGTTIYVNSVFELIKAKIGGWEYQPQELSHVQTTLVRQLLVNAYETDAFVPDGHYTADNIPSQQSMGLCASMSGAILPGL